MTKQPTDSDYARSWLQSRLDALKTEMAVTRGRVEEIARLIGELDKDVRPVIQPVAQPTERQWKGRVAKGNHAALRGKVLSVLRSAGSKGMRLSDLRDALKAEGVTYPTNFVSIVLHEEKVLGNVEHNSHTGRHRWVGGKIAVKKPLEIPSGPRTGPRLGYIGPHRQMVRDVTQAANGGVTNRTIRLACEAKGVAMSNNLIGAILSVERKAGNMSFDEATGSYHWIAGRAKEEAA